MNHEQAIKTLQLYRPNSADEHDPDFAEALVYAKEDPELDRWLDEHGATFEIIRLRMRETPVPAGLKEQILAGHKNLPAILPLPGRSWWKPALAAAAIMVLLLSLSFFWPSPQPEHANAYRQRMVSTALRLYKMDLETSDAGQVRDFLAQRNAPSDYSLPPELEKQEWIGCAVLRWQDKPVSMICFRTGRPLPPGEKGDLFLFIADRHDVDQESAVVERVNRLVTASWIDGDKLYLLATPGDEAFIRKFL